MIRLNRIRGGPFMTPWKALVAAITLWVVFLQSAGAEGFNHHLYMYKDPENRKPTTLFSPYDRIVVHIQFLDLPAGEYVFHADWFNTVGELQDSSRYRFVLKERDNMTVETFLEMKRAGFLHRLFSASETTGYSVKFYGQWHVSIYLNGAEVADEAFEVR